MATVSAVVYENHKKKDGTYNVKIRIHHKGIRRLLETPHFVTRRQLNSKLQLKDKSIINIVDETLFKYRHSISEIGDRVEVFSIDELRDYLTAKEKEIDFIEFCDEHIAGLRKNGRDGTANNHRIVRNSLVDFFKGTSVPITKINSNTLFKYIQYLKSERNLVRTNQLNKEVKIKENGLSKNGLFNHLRDLRTLFNAACEYYNREDIGVYRIKHNPFKKVKLGPAPVTRKRNITIEQLKAVRDCDAKEGSRAELARDLFILSFYLCGMNAVDLYNLDRTNIRNGRIEYYRAKTTKIRRDDAFISIQIIPEACSLVDKYIETLNSKYTSHNGLDTALSIGMQELRNITHIPDLTFYWARHTFATLARNKCRIPKDEVAMALNHVDTAHRTTDIYIENDWTIIDEVQERVVKLLESDNLA